LLTKLVTRNARNKSSVALHREHLHSRKYMCVIYVRERDAK
jgi:hypothetical protein